MGMAETRDADEVLEVTIGAPVTSFRNPLFSSVTHTLPCPPPSTVAGMLGAARGGVQHLPRPTRFAYAFHAEGQGVDLETYHPLTGAGAKRGYGQKGGPKPAERGFLYGCELHVWLQDDLDGWERALRAPVWPLKLGRSQDLIDAPRVTRVPLQRTTEARLGDAVVPVERLAQPLPPGPQRIRMPAEVSTDRERTRWVECIYAPNGSEAVVSPDAEQPQGLATTQEGQIVAFHIWDGRLG